MSACPGGDFGRSPRPLSGRMSMLGVAGETQDQVIGLGGRPAGAGARRHSNGNDIRIIDRGDDALNWVSGAAQGGLSWGSEHGVKPPPPGAPAQERTYDE